MNENRLWAKRLFPLGSVRELLKQMPQVTRRRSQEVMPTHPLNGPFQVTENKICFSPEERETELLSFTQPKTGFFFFFFLITFL
ncbi:hypothetical protein CEXT_22701 [Caerostris extrusa]|uniref:Uncharacterized protein n=1 Tax=Caerostris extrusa TaxID=172846 RepID=A0AAV4MF72_CAEEX|nr:hypothetical protein CEXT_22701 [Caerostris extrusa]